MHDIKSIRENPEGFKAALKRRKGEYDVARILTLDEEKRFQQQQLESLKAQRNEVAKRIPEEKKKGADVTELLARGNQLKEEIATCEAEAGDTSALQEMLSSIPNLLAADVPDGADESANVEQPREVLSVEYPDGVPPKKDFSGFTPKEHFEIGEALGMMDFESAAKLSGSRFVVLRGDLARLERALAAFMLDIHVNEFGYTEHQVPYLVKDAALFGTGQLPKFSEDLFKTTGEHWLIPTSEVSLTNLVANEILDEARLPMRLTAHTPCFRSEAGSAGRDTRGMIRQHQFSKVELVGITTPEESEKEHKRMLAAAERILKRLELHYRVMMLCSGDTGFSAQKTYDIEVWLPGQNAYREISSISNCGDFQARRMKARYRQKDSKETRFVHTLNGSGLAVGRTLVALLENCQQPNGSILVPNVLIPYMSGRTFINRMNP